MKKLFSILFLVVGAALLFLFLKSTNNTKKQTMPKEVQQKGGNAVIQSETLFVPYWSQDSIPDGYDTYVYFGIAPNENGINTTDTGYKGLVSFAAKTQEKKTLLAVRVLDSNFTEKVLQDSTLQESIIQDTVQIVQSYGFGGVVLDLEYSGLAFPSVTASITNFSIRFAKEVKVQNIAFYQALYGDSYYLDRPYNIKEIAKNTDGVFVMSYDFHKANGTPGPNFPMEKRLDSDYTFGQMITDFSKDVPKEKLTIIFGMFGYDWTVDDKERSIGSAKSMSANDMQTMFSNKIIRDPKSFEPHTMYTDRKGQHIVWWEDMQSMGRKRNLVEQRGISKIGFWANGYF